ncbi:hypothetical protein DITRI_Ditri05aG0128500 [Diplodiscus trichospermus]
MESGSEAANLEFQTFDFNEVELADNRNMVENFEENETPENFSKGIEEVGSPCRSSPIINQPNCKQNIPASDHDSENNGPKLALSGRSPGDDPALIESSQMQKTAENVEVELQRPSATDDQPQLDPMNANPDTAGRGCVSHDANSNPSHEQGELVSSPGITDDCFLDYASSKENIMHMQPKYSGFEGTDSSHAVATNAQQTVSTPSCPLIMETTQSFSLALFQNVSPLTDIIGSSKMQFLTCYDCVSSLNQAEKLPQSESYEAQSFYSEHDGNSVQANELNGQTGSSLQAKLLPPQRVEPDNPGKTFCANQFEQNNGNNNFNDNHQALPYPNMFPQSPSGFGFLKGGSTQINQQAHTWVCNKENDLSRTLAPSGSQVNHLKSANNSDKQCYNVIPPESCAYLRPRQLNNPLQLLNQVPNMPNASDSLLQHSMLTMHSMPLQHMPQHFSYQHNQVPIEPGRYNSRTCSTILPESSMPLRNPILPPPHQSSMQSQASMLSSGGFITNQFGTQCSNSMLQESLMPSGSHPLSSHRQSSNSFSMMPNLPNSEHHNSEQPENSILPRLQTVQQQGLLSQTARPTAAYPSHGTLLSSPFLNSLLEQVKTFLTTKIPVK